MCALMDEDAQAWSEGLDRYDSRKNRSWLSVGLPRNGHFPDCYHRVWLSGNDKWACRRAGL